MMHIDYYRDLIIRAVAEDESMLDSIASTLFASTDALSILRAKGYGVHGMQIDATARLVPEAD
jgi:hypothetical protein